MSFQRYESRNKAGVRTAKFMLKMDPPLGSCINASNSFCFAIPNGGVPVAEGFCSHLDIKYDILIVRKVKIPFNPEAGFGSVTTDGTVLLNKPLLSQLNLTEDQIQKSIATTKQEIQERLAFYHKKTFLGERYKELIEDKHIFMVDDGLASGFTMLAAIQMIKKYFPKDIFVAVPTAPQRTVEKLESEVKDIFCPNVKHVAWFAVANAYKHWYDVPESEVQEILNHSNFYVDSA
ncbi:MAG: phosphoribosyltransferase [Promethearchaeota archaeon]|nr:MAG: phosphoribosyltransferase [Candidatus Lokiarchaeota archaeon]